jgi:hypothetical protein
MHGCIGMHGMYGMMCMHVLWGAHECAWLFLGDPRECFDAILTFTGLLQTDRQ